LIKIAPRLSVTSNEAALNAAVKGFGITRLLSYQVAADIQAGRLVVLMPEYESAELPLHILHREGRHASAKVRTFIDLMAERLRGNVTLAT